MRKVFFALIFGLLFADLACANSELDHYKEECIGIIEKPKVSVKYSFGRLRYDFKKNRNFIEQEKKKNAIYENVEELENVEIDGLTSIRNTFEVNVEAKQIGVSDGYQCVYPEAIDVYLGYFAPIIYIANDLPKDSCRYNLALRHEKTHMQLYIESLIYILPQLKQKAIRSVEDIGVKIVKGDSNIENVAKVLYEEYVKYLKDFVESWQKDMFSEQLKLDSYENYMIESRICKEIDNLE